MGVDYDHLKLCAARYVYKRQNELTPKGKILWRDWFALKFHTEYDVYIAEQMRLKK